MTTDPEDTGGDVFVVVLAALAVAVVCYFLWLRGVIHDLVTAGIAVGVIVVYVVAAYFLLPIIDHPGETRGSALRQARHTLSRAIAYYALRPGHWIGEAIAGAWGRLMGGR